LLRHKHVPVLQVRSLPHSDLPLDSSSDDGNNDDDYHDNDTNTHALHWHFCYKCGGCKFPFSFDGDKETVTAVMTMTTMKMTMTFPKQPYHHWLQVVTPPLLLIAPFVEMILIGPVVLPILSNQVVTRMLSVTVTTLMSCCCHAQTTLCNNTFLLLTPPHL
jgi:hypothetical protein